ncbi:hypothetical protein [Streptosporangium carneum]|uniref:DUF4760 domain-containing protein n=1 Tax=Streptosporangium carneum TaxID=47481 RepID=A0A9W6HXB6_9ACTN|nr:hypothetical protein [Streptosporangium carneum]GLK07379.1 hypothetical protein GCM10017600_07840 [Streptosporangium carneum]
MIELLAVLLASGLAWLIGSQITYRWDDVKRRRELDLAAVESFYRAYGSFIEVWRLWNAHKRRSEQVAAPADMQWQCLQRAAAVEGSLEAILIKIVLERRLTKDDRLLLGCFRQAYQSLRESVREDRELKWYARKDDYEAHRRYRAFKALAVYSARLLQTNSTRWLIGTRRTDIPSSEESICFLLAATDAARRYDWLETAERILNITSLVPQRDDVRPVEGTS